MEAWKSLAAGGMTVAAIGWIAPAGATAEPSLPKVRLEPAPVVRIPGDVDSNSPGFWDERGLHVFASNQNPSISNGPDLENLGPARRTRFLDDADVLRWIESVHLDGSGTLWGLYHREDYRGECDGRPYYTVPRIGVARSDDRGLHWRDLGLILADDVRDDSCDASPNEFFAGGVGDPSWAIDEKEGYAYVVFSGYGGEAKDQGVLMARLALSDLPDPAGRAWRWTGHDWSAPGLFGRGQPVLPAKHSWHGPHADAFWGPSVHWNVALRRWVVLMNRTRGPNFEQEGAYVSFVGRLSDPRSWSKPVQLYNGGPWYVQVFGDADVQGTDSRAGASARFFQHGVSRYRIHFLPPES